MNSSTPITPGFLNGQIKELRSYLNILEEKVEEAKKKHRPLKRGTGTYDDVNYWTFMIMCHTDMIRAHMVKTEELGTVTLANGTVMTNNGIE